MRFDECHFGSSLRSIDGQSLISSVCSYSNSNTKIQSKNNVKNIFRIIKHNKWCPSCINMLKCDKYQHKFIVFNSPAWRFWNDRQKMHFYATTEAGYYRLCSGARYPTKEDQSSSISTHGPHTGMELLCQAYYENKTDTKAKKREKWYTGTDNKYNWRGWIGNAHNYDQDVMWLENFIYTT